MQRGPKSVQAAAATTPAHAGAGPDPSRLTPRQLEVLRLIGRGLTDAQIAEALFLSRRTVHAHVRAIFRTLEVSRRSAATRYAMQHGLT
jgi:DNA-binding NarL/FixJ family response regulator